MKQTIFFAMLVCSLMSCKYKHSLAEADVLAGKFFDGKMPAQVMIPEKLKGKPDERYKVEKFSLNFHDKNIKVFYTLNRKGLVGNMYIDGFNLNTTDTSTNVALTRDQYLHELIHCGDSFKCALGVFDQLERDCKAFRNSEHCWYCKDFGGPDDCSWLH